MWDIIGDSAFYDRDNLTDIRIPDSVMYIGDYAFDFCEKLTNVTLPNGITRIGTQLFQACPLKDAVIPDSVVEIGDPAEKSVFLRGYTHTVHFYL